MKKRSVLEGLNDKQIVKEVLRYLEAQGVVLVYLDGRHRQIFTQASTCKGRQWAAKVARLLLLEQP